MAASYSDRDTSLIPDITFSFVEDYIRTNKFSSGQKSINKGYKYYSESYIHCLKVAPTQTGCKITGRCHKSQRKSEEPYGIQVEFLVGSCGPTVHGAKCDCAIGVNACCGHITGLLYQIANIKMLGIKALPEDIAKTSMPQTFHIPRGQKIAGKAVQDIEVRGYSKIKEPGSSNEEVKTIRSTLYNAIRGEPTNWAEKSATLAAAHPHLLVLPALNQAPKTVLSSKFGQVLHGSVLSYQQKCDNDFIINVVDGVCFPKFPVGNFMQNNDVANLSQEQDIKLKGLQLSYGDINKFEEKTRLQSQSPLWFRIREHRITASNIGRVYKRRKDDEKLAKQLKSTRRVVTAAMKRGIACEPQAAKRYAEVCENRVNLYPCGVVVSFWAPWLAASPDRKVYDPTRNPPFGLLEIKCPQVTSVLEAACLKKDVTGQLALNRNHDYYYQVLAQLACTGLEWCDFFVWTENDHHMEAVYFNQDVWNTVKNKVDKFYFNHFI